MKVRTHGTWLFTVAALLMSPAIGASNSSDSHAAAAQGYITTMDLDAATEALRLGDPSSFAVRAESARLAVYRGDCGEAVRILDDHAFAAVEATAQLREIAVGCERVTAATHAVVDEAAEVEIHFQDPHDEVLTQVIVETIVRARESLTRDLHATWPKPTRVIVVRDLLSLAAVTGLPYESAKTTGTVAVAKWGRVTLLSPRAAPHGFPWRDTIAHELTHLAITRSSRDRAPLWLQEGLAKREEIRWRDPAPFDGTPPPEEIVLDGIRRHVDVPLDKLGPSLAMLPSADIASVAFAEVTSFVHYLVESAGDAVLPRLLAAIAEEDDIDTALTKASGANRKEWDVRWREMLAPKLAEEPKNPDKKASPGHASGAAAGKSPAGHPLSPMVGRRLAELLLGRDHPAEALSVLQSVPADLVTEDVRMASLRARALLRLGRVAEAGPLLANATDYDSPYPPWWAIRGIWARAIGDNALAEASFAESVATNPFDTLAACEREMDVSVDPGANDDESEGNWAESLCSAAESWGEPRLGTE